MRKKILFTLVLTALTAQFVGCTDISTGEAPDSGTVPVSNRDIDVTAMPEESFDHASGFGRSFAASGGVAAAVGQGLKEMGSAVEAKTIACSGIEECKLALLKMSKGVLPENFIEGMACQGGCVQGPGMLMRSPQNKAEVTKHAGQAGAKTISEAVSRLGAKAEVPATSSDKKPGGAIEKSRAKTAQV